MASIRYAHYALLETYLAKINPPTQQLKTTKDGQQCKPGNRRQIQLWKKTLVTDRERLETQQAADYGDSSIGQAGNGK